MGSIATSESHVSRTFRQLRLATAQPKPRHRLAGAEITSKRAVLCALIGLAALFFLLPTAQAGARSYIATDLGTLGGAGSAATAVNNSGQVAGEAQTAGGDSHAFLWTAAGGMVDLGTLGGAAGAAALNDGGEVVGQAQTARGDVHAFMWTAAGGMVDLGTLGGAASQALGVNDSGQVVGMAQTAAGVFHAFSWTEAGGMIDLGPASNAIAVNNHGQVVGTEDGQTQYAFSWTAAGGIVDLGTLGGLNSYARGVNDSGQVAGDAYPPSGIHSFLWTAGGGMVDLGTVDDRLTQTVGINAHGQVAGNTYTANDERAFSWTAAGGMVDLGTLGGDTSIVTAVGDTGEVVGLSYLANRVQRAFSWSATGGMVDLGTLGGATSEAAAISDNGQVAGAANAASGEFHAVLWRPQQTLSVSLGGSGSGTVTGSGISCPEACSSDYAAGTPVTLTAAPEPGSTFAGWSGGCTGASLTCQLTLNGDASVTATFFNASPGDGGNGSLPSVVTGAASHVTSTGAMLNGSVDPNGLVLTDCHFEYGLDTTHGSSVPCAQSVGTGTSPVSVSAVVSGLKAGTTYHFELVARNANGLGYASDATFTTACSIDPFCQQTTLTTPDIKIVQYIKDFGQVPGTDCLAALNSLEVRHVYSISLCIGLAASANPDPPARLGGSAWRRFVAGKEYRGFVHLAPFSVQCQLGQVTATSHQAAEESVGFTPTRILDHTLRYAAGDPFTEPPYGHLYNTNPLPFPIAGPGVTVLVETASRIAESDRELLFEGTGYDAPFIWTELKGAIGCSDYSLRLRVTEFPSVAIYVNNRLARTLRQSSDIRTFISQGCQVFENPGAGRFDFNRNAHDVIFTRSGTSLEPDHTFTDAGENPAWLDQTCPRTGIDPYDVHFSSAPAVHGTQLRTSFVSPGSGTLIAQLVGVTTRPASRATSRAHSARPRQAQTVILAARTRHAHPGKRIRLALKVDRSEEQLLKRRQVRKLALRLILVESKTHHVLEAHRPVKYRRG